MLVINSPSAKRRRWAAMVLADRMDKNLYHEGGEPQGIY